MINITFRKSFSCEDEREKFEEELKVKFDIVKSNHIFDTSKPYNIVIDYMICYDLDISLTELTERLYGLEIYNAVLRAWTK